MADRKAKNVFILYFMTLLFCLITGIILIVGEKSPETIDTLSELSVIKTLIIDPGHGGADGGAVAADGTTESTINLDIALKTKALGDFLGINSVLTRQSEELPYPADADTIAAKKRWDQRRRLEQINSRNNAVFLSIHQNFYPDPRPSGVQVLYGKDEYSKYLGELIHGELNAHLCPNNRRLASPAAENIYLMNKAECPAILVECGFMSNDVELKMLMDSVYQKKIASILIMTYLKAST